MRNHATRTVISGLNYENFSGIILGAETINYICIIFSTLLHVSFNVFNTIHAEQNASDLQLYRERFVLQLLLNNYTVNLNDN